MTREENLTFIYKICFQRPALREKFFREWKYIATALADNEDDFLGDEVIEAVSDWLEVTDGEEATVNPRIKRQISF